MNYKFELLQELCDICKENDIKYFLYGTLMQAAYTDGVVNPKWDSYDVAVTGEGFLKLQQILSSDSFAAEHPDRVMESPLTNPNFPGFYANYVATDTLYFDFRDDFRWFRYKGMAIHILIIANRKKSKSKVARARNYLRRKYLMTLRTRPVRLKKRIPYDFFHFLFSLRGEAFRKKMFRDYVAGWRSVSEPSELYLADGRRASFKKDLWEKDVKKTLDDVTFPFPQICMRKIVKKRFYDLNVIRSEMLSYDEFLKMCREQNIDLEEVYRDRRKNRDAMVVGLRQGRKDKRYYNAAFYGTAIRRDISRRVEQCESKSLESPEYFEVIEEYLGDIQKQYKNGITPYVTMGIYLDAMRVFLKNNEEGYHSRSKIVRDILLQYAEKIPDHYFLQTPVIPESCYSEEETGKSAAELRELLVSRLNELVEEMEEDKEDNESQY
jgi:hypothetical protein